jgi:hypothetical protein
MGTVTKNYIIIILLEKIINQVSVQMTEGFQRRRLKCEK